MPRTLEDCLDDRDRQVINDIAAQGWHVVDSAADNLGLGWSFSVGLYQSFGHPEVVVFGLGAELGRRVVTTIAEAVKAGGSFKPGKDYADLLPRCACVFEPVQPRWQPWALGYARWYYRSDEFPALQCIWPDKRQNHPWQMGYKAEWTWQQPLLYQTDPVKARALELLKALRDGE